MRRCALAFAFAGLVAFWALPAAAQTPRNFPATALRGELVITAPPEVLLNKKPARLAPGSRLRGQDNMLVMTGAAAAGAKAARALLSLDGALTSHV